MEQATVCKNACEREWVGKRKMEPREAHHWDHEEQRVIAERYRKSPDDGQQNVGGGNVAAHFGPKRRHKRDHQHCNKDRDRLKRCQCLGYELRQPRNNQCLGNRKP